MVSSNSAPPNELTPPLLPPSCHEGIRFVLGEPDTASERLPDETIAIIAAALSALLPTGDFSVSEIDRRLCMHDAPQSAWSIASRLEGISRSSTL